MLHVFDVEGQDMSAEEEAVRMRIMAMMSTTMVLTVLVKILELGPHILTTGEGPSVINTIPTCVQGEVATQKCKAKAQHMNRGKGISIGNLLWTHSDMPMPRVSGTIDGAILLWTTLEKDNNTMNKTQGKKPTHQVKGSGQDKIVH